MFDLRRAPARLTDAEREDIELLIEHIEEILLTDRLPRPAPLFAGRNAQPRYEPLPEAERVRLTHMLEDLRSQLVSG